MYNVTLTEEEIALVREALDSYEYWEHRDELPHNSGHITIMDDQDFEQQITLSRCYDEDEVEAKTEAWDAVKDARALDSKLHAVVTPAEGSAPAPATVVVVMRDPDASNEYRTFGPPVQTVDVDYGYAELRNRREFDSWADSHTSGAEWLREQGHDEAASFLLSLVAQARWDFGHDETEAEALDALADNETADEVEYHRLRAEAARLRLSPDER